IKIKTINSLFTSIAKDAPIYLSHLGMDKSKIPLEEVRSFYDLPKEKIINRNLSYVQSYNKGKVHKAEIVSADTIVDQKTLIWTLSNNVKVVYKYLDSYTGVFNFSAYKKQKRLPIDNFITSIMNKNYGLQNKNYYDYLGNCNIDFNTSSNYNYIYGSSSVLYIDKLFQMLAERQQINTISKEYFEQLKKEYIQRCKNNSILENQINDELNNFSFDNYYTSNQEVKALECLGYDEFIDRYRKHFTDFDNYEFHIVGNIKPTPMRRYIKRHLSMIQPTKKGFASDTISLNVTPKASKTDSLHLKSDQTEQSKIKYRLLLPYNYTHNGFLMLSIYSGIIRNRILTKLRNEHQIIYTVDTDEYSSYIEKIALIDLTIDLQSKNKEKALKLIDAELATPISNDEFDKEKKIFDSAIQNLHKDIRICTTAFFNEYFTSQSSFRNPMEIKFNLEEIQFDNFTKCISSWKDQQRTIKVIVN
ncbi:insulinase family protein, partial [Prolixibacteraceae bacterium]|nr:insulinase family protein [Prolixibacteraceae bacterium]